MSDRATQIIDLATKYTGLHEVTSNASWSDPTLSPELIAMFKAAGWQSGWPYCITFAKAIWMKAYADDAAKLAWIKKCLSPSVMGSYNNPQVRSMVTKNPTPGSIFFFQHGQTGNGHAGLVVSSSGSTMVTIEGNTSPGQAASVAQDRQGDGIYKKTRNIVLVASSTALWCRGFLAPL